MSAERDELVQIIDDRWHGYGYNPQGAAAAIIAAGYSKPRLIYTAEELDALPAGSVIRTGGYGGQYAPQIAEKLDTPSCWQVANPDSIDVTSDELNDFPATVLYEGAR